MIMMDKIWLIISILFCSFSGALAFANEQDDQLNDLVSQLNGGQCKYKIQGNSFVNRPRFSGVLRRNDNEYCIIDAAQALSMMGPQARSAVPDLIEALNKYHNIEADGGIPVRSEIALALGKVGDPSAIKPLIAILNSDDPATFLDPTWAIILP